MYGTGFPSCINTPPNPIPLASHSSSKVLVKSGSWSKGACVNLSFNNRECFFLCSTPNKRHILLCKLTERCSNGAEISHKTPIESSEAKETPHVCGRFGLRPTLNSFSLGFINLNSLWSNNIAKKRDSVGAKGALSKVTKQTCIT